MPIYFHPEARAELIEAAEWYESQQPGLRHRFLAAVEEALQRVESSPSLYKEVDAGIRQCRVRRFPYGILFRYTSCGIEVLAVMH